MIMGVFFGIFLGALPGFGATLGIAILIPFTFGLDPELALPMLAGVYSGAIYGGSITAIMVGIPGTSAAAATVIDGFEMTRKGESRKALTTAVFSSSFGGFVGGFSLLLFATILSKFTLKFGPAEYFMLSLFGLTIIATVVGKSMIKGLIAGLLGLLLGMVGIDPITGFNRFTFGQMYLIDGFPLIPVILALFAFPRSLTMIRDIFKEKKTTLANKLFRENGEPMTLKGMRRMWKILVRSSIIGTVVGMIPGAGANIACWIGVSEAKRNSKHPERFGTGIPEGVVAAEAANNATEGGSLIPMLTLSIPGSSAAAVMFGALMIHGMVPGPMLFTKYALTTYTYIWAIIINSFIMLIIGYYGSRLFARLANIPLVILTPVMILITLLGAFAMRQLVFDVWITIILGTVCYLLSLSKYPMPPILLGFILGPIAEKGFRRAMLISHNDWTIFFTRPICIILIIFIILSLYTGIRIMKDPQKK
jgi:putative tricarboxylic transport membrane protein